MRDRRRLGEKISPQLLREARLRQQDGEWLSSAKPLVLRRYRGKYVAIRNKRILAASTTMKGLYAKLDKLILSSLIAGRTSHSLRVS
ncbi:hypothetical protein E6H25_06030 [Candidatus Bathyarchaeota archaeon]|nr:MAG: hypothetical protein E6H25_06030 [Candidatus Bathyarchaeota archaeon]